MTKEKICVGADSRSFCKDGMKYTIEMIQMDPKTAPTVAIWAGWNRTRFYNPALISQGTYNGIAYVCDKDDDPNLYGDDYEKVSSLCQDMAV